MKQYDIVKATSDLAAITISLEDYTLRFYHRPLDVIDSFYNLFEPISSNCADQLQSIHVTTDPYCIPYPASRMLRQVHDCLPAAVSGSGLRQFEHIDLSHSQ